MSSRKSNINELHRQYLQIFQTRLIPEACGQRARPILAHPLNGAATRASQLPQGVRVHCKAAPLLRESRRTHSYVRSFAWPDAGFHASRFAILLYVVEGEIDLRIGVTQQAAREYSGLSRRHGYQVWRLPAGTLCVIPPGVPFDDSDQPHWREPDLSRARSRLQWIQLIPAGALLHLCETKGATHEITPFLCVHDSRLILLGELLCEQLASTTTRASEVTRALLAALLWRVEQGIASSQPVEMTAVHEADSEYSPQADDRAVAYSAALRRAQRFIEAHLQEPLTVEAIATSAYSSSSSLNRQFKSEFGASVMEYVTQCRLQEARLLLKDTDMPISEIGKLVGFPVPSYFSQVFTRREKISPSRFRRENTPHL